MAKQVLKLQVTCVTKNERQAGGNALFAFQPEETKDSGTVARKAFNYQTTDNKELANFSVGETYTITIEK